MIKTQLLKYIKTSIEDEYAMEVLYYCIKDAALKNGFVFNNESGVEINGKYHGEPILIGMSNRFQSQIKTVALLLSIRALMLNKNYLKCCNDDYLIFTSSTFGKFQWIEFATILMDCMDDDEFSCIYGILEELYFEDAIPEDAIEELRSGLTAPEYRGTEKYYKNIASANKGIADEVICNNAFINEDFEDYTVPEGIAFVGNTAFSYCSNLTTLRFAGKVIFGIFPIIECRNLKQIIVPTEHLDYYKEELPYYQSIITDKEKAISVEQQEETISESNKGKRWTTDEEEKVKRFFGLGQSFKAIAHAMGRTEVAIKARLGKLGLIDYTYTNEAETENEESCDDNKVAEIRKYDIPEDYVPKGKLKTIPEQATNTYDILWFMAIVEKLQLDPGTSLITLKDAAFMMIAVSWGLLAKDKETRNKEPELCECLEYIVRWSKRNVVYELSSRSGLEDVYSCLKSMPYHGKLRDMVDAIIKKVPYSTLKAWFQGKSDSEIARYSMTFEKACLYAIHENKKEPFLEINKGWRNYLYSEHDNLIGYFTKQYYDFLEEC